MYVCMADLYKFYAYIFYLYFEISQTVGRPNGKLNCHKNKFRWWISFSLFWGINKSSLSFFVIFHFSKKERIKFLEIKERIFNFLFWVQLSWLHFVAIAFARTLRWWLIWGLHNECMHSSSNHWAQFPFSPCSMTIALYRIRAVPHTIYYCGRNNWMPLPLHGDRIWPRYVNEVMKQ